MHAGPAAGTTDDDQWQSLDRGSLDRTGQFLADHGPHAAHDERRIRDAEGHTPGTNHARPDDGRVAQPGALLLFLQPVAIGLFIGKAQRVERLKNDLLARPEVQDLIASVWGSVRAMMVAAAEDERSELRMRTRASLLTLGGRMATDTRLQAKVDSWLEDAATYLVTTYRDQITSLISETVAGWDAEQTSRKIEAHVGRDLQFIRINGTVVGALVGLLIFTVSRIAGS